MSLDLTRPSLSVFFGNLDPRVTEAILYDLAVQAGPVSRVKINGDGKKKAFAFVEFEHLDSAIYCVGLYHKLLNLFGSAVSVAFSKNEFPAADMTDTDRQLVTAVRQLLASTGEPGVGAARRSQAAGGQRFAPYSLASGRGGEGRAAGRLGGGSGWDSASSGREDRYPQWEYGREPQLAHVREREPDSAQPWQGYPQQQQQQGGWGFGGASGQHNGGGGSGSGYQPPEPVPGWQERAAAAAAEAAAAAAAELSGPPSYQQQHQQPQQQVQYQPHQAHHHAHVQQQQQAPAVMHQQQQQPQQQQQQQVSGHVGYQTQSYEATPAAQPAPSAPRGGNMVMAAAAAAAAAAVAAAPAPVPVALGGFSSSGWNLPQEQQQYQSSAPYYAHQYGHQQPQLQPVVQQYYQQPQVQLQQQPQHTVYGGWQAQQPQHQQQQVLYTQPGGAGAPAVYYL